MNIIEKTCPRCKETKAVEEFYKDKARYDGLHSYCKDCVAKRRRELSKRPINRMCKIDDCDKRHYARGWCQMHYRRWQDHGDPGEAARRHGVKGDGHIHSGYKVLAMSNHPNATKRGKLMEHIFVMSESLRRPLRKGETVHHINGIKTDNRLENLELWTGNHPTGQRATDLQDFATEIAFGYGLVGEMPY